MHPQTLWHAFWHTHAHACARWHTRESAHTTWCGQYVRAKQSLACEPVTIIGSTEGFCRGGLAETTSALETLPLPLLSHESQRDLQIPKTLISLWWAALVCGTVPLRFVFLHLFTLGHVAFGRMLRNQRQSPSCDFPTAAALSPSRPQGKTATAQWCVQDKTAAVGGRRRTFSVGVMEIYAKIPRMSRRPCRESIRQMDVGSNVWH